MTRWKRPGPEEEWTREVAGGRVLLSVYKWCGQYWGRAFRAMPLGPYKLESKTRGEAQAEMLEVVRAELQSLLSKLPEPIRRKK